MCDRLSSEPAAKSLNCGSSSSQVVANVAATCPSLGPLLLEDRAGRQPSVTTESSVTPFGRLAITPRVSPPLAAAGLARSALGRRRRRRPRASAWRARQERRGLPSGSIAGCSWMTPSRCRRRARREDANRPRERCGSRCGGDSASGVNRRDDEGDRRAIRRKRAIAQPLCNRAVVPAAVTPRLCPAALPTSRPPRQCHRRQDFLHRVLRKTLPHRKRSAGQRFDAASPCPCASFLRRSPTFRSATSPIECRSRRLHKPLSRVQYRRMRP